MDYECTAGTLHRYAFRCQRLPVNNPFSMNLPFLLLHDWNVATRGHYAIAYYLHKFACAYARLIQ